MSKFVPVISLSLKFSVVPIVDGCRCERWVVIISMTVMCNDIAIVIIEHGGRFLEAS